MKTQIIMVLGLVALFSAERLHGEYVVSDRGDWPKDWPQELEPLRKQSKTLLGPRVLFRQYLIGFTDREQFEAAWPHLLKAKTKGAPIFLMRKPSSNILAARQPMLYCIAPRKTPRTPKHQPSEDRCGSVGDGQRI